MNDIFPIIAVCSFLMVVMGLAINLSKGSTNENWQSYGYLSFSIFIVLFIIACIFASSLSSYKEDIITDYCNGKIVVDTVAVTKDGKLYEIKIKEEVK